MEGLRRHLAEADVDRVVLSFDQIDALLEEPLPPTARQHRAFWSNTSAYSPAWTRIGYRTSTAGCPAGSIAFVRATDNESAAPPRALGRKSPDQARSGLAATGQVLLLGCGKRKLDHPAPTADLYVGPIFRARKAFAEGTGLEWFVLSAKYGLLDPEEIVAPYDLALADQSVAYRREWAERVAGQLAERFDDLTIRHFELHAGAAYTRPLMPALAARGSRWTAPLAGRTQGATLAWYARAAAGPPAHVIEGDHQGAGGRTGPLQADAVEVKDLVAGLADPARARSAAEFPWRQAESLREPGLYSWWVDPHGARRITEGLGHPIAAGLIYAGQTGATAWPSGKKRTTTLFDRIGGNHLHGRVSGSTFRLTIAAALHSARAPADEDALSAWMREHLSVIAIPYPDRDRLGAVEAAALELLDPPLNLMGMRPTPLRVRLGELRRALLDHRDR